MPWLTDSGHGLAFPRQVLREACFVTSPDGGQRAQGGPGAGGARMFVRYRGAHGVDHGLAERPASLRGWF